MTLLQDTIKDAKEMLKKYEYLPNIKQVIVYEHFYKNTSLNTFGFNFDQNYYVVGDFIREGRLPEYPVKIVEIITNEIN